MSNQNNPTLAILNDNLQKSLGAIYDAQYTQLNEIVVKAYNMGLTEGKFLAKTEIINLINGGSDETNDR